MRHSKLVNFAYRILPFSAWKDWLLRHHIDHCPACREQLVSREEARRLLVQAHELGDLGGLWPSVRIKLGKRAKKAGEGGLPKPALVKIWRLAVPGVVVLLVAVALNFWLLQKPRPEISGLGGGPGSAETEQVQIHYVRIENEPAQTFIFQPRDSNILIVWAGKNL
jgi:hypothetical protein